MAEIPFVQARWFTKTGGRHVALIVLHQMQTPVTTHAAMDVAQYFARLPRTNKASAHRCYDPGHRVDCVRDKDVAYHAPGANSDGIGLEMPGYSADDAWNTPAMQQVLNRVALDVVDLCSHYAIPIRWRSASDLLAGGDRRRGICDHKVVSQAHHMTDHTDCGVHFRPDAFIDRCLAIAGDPSPPVDHSTFLPGDDDMPLAPGAVVGTLSVVLAGVNPDANSRACYSLTADGGVRALLGAPFYGSYPGLPPLDRQGTRYFTGITPNEDGSIGYTLWANDGAKYGFGPGLNGY